MFLLLFSIASSQEVVEKKSFEGIVSFEIRDSQSIEPVTLYVKNERLRLEGGLQAGGDAMLIDYRLKKTFIIASGREQYVELPMVSAPSKPDVTKLRVDLHKTDSTMDIAGYTNDQFLLTINSTEIEIWATKELGTAGVFLTPQVGPSERKILEMGYFPMRFIALDSTGEETRRFEVTGVQKKSLSESLFSIPAGYEKIDPSALQPKQAPKKRKSR